MFRGDDLSSARARRDAFDPIAAGAHYRLSPEVAAEIWQQLCREAGSAADAADDERLRQQFHALASRVAARGGRLRPEVGKTTGLDSPTPATRSSWLRPEVGKTTGLDSPIPASRARSLAEELGPRTPGRTTHVLDELVDQPWGQPLGVPRRAEGSSPAIRPHGPPGARDVADALASLATPQIAPARPRTKAADPMRRQFGIGLAGLLGHRMAATLYRRAVTGALVDLRDPAVASALHQRGGGLPVSEDLRRPVERELGVSLTGVRIHTGAVAAQAAHALGAEAFTIGQDIFFADGRFAPETAAGKQLLAHELTHAAQMLRGQTRAARDGMRLSDPDEALEREAHEVAARVASGDGARSAPGSRDADDARPTAAPPTAAAAPADDGVLYRAPAAGAAAPAVAVPDQAEVAQDQAVPPDVDPETRAAIARRDPRLLAAQRDPALGESTTVAVRKPDPRTRSTPAVSIPLLAREQTAPRTAPTADPTTAIADARTSAPSSPTAKAAAAAPIQRLPAVPALPTQQLGGVTPFVPPPIKPAAVPVTDEFGFAPPDVNKLIPPRTPYDTRQDRANAETIAINEYNSDRTHASGKLRAFQADTNGQISGLHTVVPQIDATLTSGETSAVAQVDSAANAARSKVETSFAHAIAQTHTAGDTLRQTIETQTLVCSLSVLMVTMQAEMQALAAHQAAMAVVDAAETAQLAQLDSLYEAAKAKVRAAGVEAATLATTIAEQRATEFLSHKINREDNIWVGRLTDKRCDAQAKAARDVGKSFSDEVTKSGSDQADKLDAQKPGDQANIRNLANGIRDQLDKGLCVTLCNLESSSKDALDGLQKSRTTVLDQVQSSEHDAVSALQDGRDSARSAIDQDVRDLEAGIRTERAATAAALHTRVQQATDDLRSSQAKFLAGLRGKDVPEPGAIDEAVAATGQQIAAQLAADRQDVLAIAASCVQSLHQTAATGQHDLADVSTSAAGMASDGAAQIVDGFTKFGADVTKSLVQYASDYTKGTADYIAQGVDTIQKIGAGVHDQYDQNTQQLQTGFDQTYNLIRSALMKSVDGVDRPVADAPPPPTVPQSDQPEPECCPEHESEARPTVQAPPVPDDSQDQQSDSKTINPMIDDEAAKARKAVQPRWKAALMWIITAIVTIVVAVVLGPMVIGAIAGFAGAFMAAGVATAVATVVGGAILGAATSFVLTLIDNGMNGRPLMEGMGMAVLMGVIGGAAGGGLGAIMDKAVGAIVTKIAGSFLKNAGKTVIKVFHGSVDGVSELAQDFAGNVMGAAIQGKITHTSGAYQFSWNDLSQSGVGLGAGKKPRKIRIDEQIHIQAHSFGANLGGKLGGKGPGAAGAGGAGNSHAPAPLPPSAAAPAVPKQDLPKPNASPPPLKLSDTGPGGKSATPHGKPGAGAGPVPHAKPDAGKASGGASTAAAGPSPTPGAGSKGSHASGDAAHGPGAPAGAAPAAGATGTPHAGGASAPGAAAAHGSSSHGGGAAPAGHGDAGHGAASAGQDTVKTKAAVDWGVVQSVNVTGQPTAGAKHGADAELGVDFHQGVSELGSVLGHELHPANDQLTAKGPKLESGAAAQVAALNQLPPKRLPRPHGEADAPAMAHNRLIRALGELHAATAAAKTAHDGPSKQAALENSISAYLKVKSATDLVHIVTRDEQKIINDPNTPVGLDGSPALVFATKGDPLLKAAAWLKPVSGQIDVVVHGTSNNFKVRKGGKMVDLDIDHIAEVIKAHTGGNQDIRLISCSTGSHDTSVAQVLADKLGVKVNAPSDTVWITHDGRTVIGKNAFEATGTWNSYAPKKPPQTDVAPSDLPKPGDKLAGHVAAGDDTLKPDTSDPVALADVKPVTVDLGQPSSQPAPVRQGYQQFNPRGGGADGNVYDHAPGTQFEGQDKVGTSFLNDGAPRISNAAAPPLRISPNGKLAIEDTDLTTRQPKHFFAAPDAVPGWNKSLEAAGSRYRIVTVDAQTVSFTLPAGGGQQTLVKAQAQNITTKALGNDLTTAMNCDDVVQKVTGSSGEPKPQTANPLATPPAGPTQAIFYDSYVAADLAAAAGRGGPTGGVPPGGFNVTNPAAGVNDVTNNYGDAMHGHLNGAPNAALDTRMQDLGVNQYANPKVGQGFVTFSQGMRVPSPGSPNQQQVHDPYNGRTLAPANSDNSWGQHWGGVVAHDDGAHVTLENYARNAEDNVAETDDSRFYFQMYGSGPGQSWHDAWSRLNTGGVPGVREFANPLTMVAAPKDSVQAFNDRAQRNYGDQYKDIKNEYASVGAATNVEDLTIASLKGLSYANKHLNSEGSSPDRADAGRLDAWRSNVGAARDAAIPGSWSESARPLLDHVGSSLDKVKKGPISAAKEWGKKLVGITGDKVTAPPTVDGAKPPDAVAAGPDLSEPVNKVGDTVGGLDHDGEHPAAVAASGYEHEHSDDSDDEGLWQRPPQRQPEPAPAPAPAPDGASTSTHAGPSEPTPASLRDDIVEKQDPEGSVSHDDGSKLTSFVPEKDWWKLYLNPENHAEAKERIPGDPGSLYDQQESKGYQSSMVAAYHEFLERPDSPHLDADHYEHMHDVVTGKLNEDKQSHAKTWSGTPDGAGPNHKNVSFGIGRNGELAGDFEGEQLNERMLASDPFKNGINTPTLKDEDKTAITYRQPGAGTMTVNYKQREAKAIVQTILTRFDTESSAARTDKEKMAAIVKAIRALHVTHPFVDANGRLNINLILPKMLLTLGFPPVVPRKMSELFTGGYSVDEITAEMFDTVKADGWVKDEGSSLGWKKAADLVDAGDTDAASTAHAHDDAPDQNAASTHDAPDLPKAGDKFATKPGVRELANPLTMVATSKDSVLAFDERAQRNYGDQYEDIKNEYASVGAATNVEDLTIASVKGLSYANKHLNSEGSSLHRADAGRLDAWRSNVGAARDAAIPGSWSESARPLLDHVGSRLDKVKKGPISAAKAWSKKLVGITGDKVTAPPRVGATDTGAIEHAVPDETQSESGAATALTGAPPHLTPDHKTADAPTKIADHTDDAKPAASTPAGMDDTAVSASAAHDEIVELITRGDLDKATAPVGLDGDPKLVFAAEGDPLRKAADWLTPVPDRIDVIVHGSSDKFLVRQDGKMVEVGIDDLAARIKTNGHAGRDIRLISCDTGKTEGSIAQQLADKLGVKVDAPSETAWITPDGRVVIGNNPFEATGTWSSYAPNQAWKPSATPSDLVRPGDEFTHHPGSTHDTAVAAAHDSAKDPEVLLDLLPMDVFMKMNFNVPPGTTGQLGPVSFSADASVGMMAVSGNPPTIRFNPAVVSQMDPQAVYFIAQHEIAHIAHGHPDNSHVESAPNEMQADYTALVSAVTNNMAGSGWSAAGNFTKLLEQMIARGDAGGGGSHPVLTFRKERLEVLAQLIHDEATVRVEIHSPAFWPNSQMEQALGVLRVESKDVHRNPDGSSFIQGDGETGYGDYLKWCEACSALPADVRDLLTVTNAWVKGPMDVYQAHADDLRFNDKFGFVDQKVGELTI